MEECKFDRTSWHITTRSSGLGSIDKIGVIISNRILDSRELIRTLNINELIAILLFLLLSLFLFLSLLPLLPLPPLHSSCPYFYYVL